MPVTYLILAVILGIAVGLVTALRRFGGVVTFLVTVSSCYLVMISTGFSPLAFLVPVGGPGLFLVIIGMYVSLGVWAHQLSGRRKT